MTTLPDAPRAEQLADGRVRDFLEVHTLKVTDTAKREVSGLALPYGEDLDRPDWLTGARRQRFAEGSAIPRDNAVLYYGHDHLSDGMPIGKWTTHEQTADGIKVTARISETAKGEEVYTLLKDGVLDRFSVGFYRVTNHLEDAGTDDAVLVHDEIDVFEVSVVPDPAFKSARIESVLSRTPDQPTPATPGTPSERQSMTITLAEAREGLATAEDVQTLSGAIDNLERRLATIGTSTGADDVLAAPGASYGEFLKMVAANDPAAIEFLAYVGGTTDDLGAVLKDSWVGDRYKAIEAQRTVLNFFARSPLPADGMGVEYGIEGTDTTQVGEQLLEGDVLPYGKITFDTDRAPLKTYGGWGDMSRQEIERSPINVVERFYGSLLRRYAQTTEAALNARAVAGGEALTGGVLDMTTTDGWTRFIIRAARVLKDRGYPLEGLLVGFDVFEDLALMRDTNATTGDRFLNRETGRISVTGLGGEVFNVPVVPIETGATVDVIRAANSEAIRSYEAGGAPFRLQDDDITNLTKAFSIYGYMAVADEVPGAIIKPATV